MSKKKSGFFKNPIRGNLREVDPSDIYGKNQCRLLRSSILLPSQYNSYAVCTEFARDWFLDKFPQGFFNSIYVDGSKSFDQFRMFSKIDLQLKRTNPVLAISPQIDAQYNRNFIDTNYEMGGYLRRARMDGTFFSDKRPDKQLHLALQMKTIQMNFVYKMRVDTDAQQLDLLDFIKYKHRAGASENQYITLEIHVPKKIINQIAFDNAIEFDPLSGPKNPDEMLRYLNSYSVLPFLYKRRNATGTFEYFIRVENCGVHVKSELPNRDESGNKVDSETTYFTPDFQIAVEMLAPYCFIYYSQHQQSIINTSKAIDDDVIILMKAVRAELPETNEVGWNRLITTEYIVDNADLQNNITINFKDLIQGELARIIEYTYSVALSPSLFMDFIILNNGEFMDYDIDWSTNSLTLKEKTSYPGFSIGIYVDLGYVNNVKIHHNFADGFNSPDCFRTTSRIGKIE